MTFKGLRGLGNLEAFFATPRRTDRDWGVVFLHVGGSSTLPPVVGTGHVAVPQQGTFQIAVLVEAEQGVVAGALEVAVEDRTFLLTVGFADRTVQVEDDAVGRSGTVGPGRSTSPKGPSAPRGCRMGQHVRLEACHLAGGGGLLRRGPAARTCRNSAVSECWMLVPVRPSGQRGTGRRGQCQSVIDIAVGQHPAVAADRCAVELKPDRAVETEP